MEDRLLTERIIGCAMEVHRELGPGLLESAYEECLAYELRLQGFRVETQVPLPVVYKEVALECGYKMDVVVNDRVLLELKAVDAIIPVHEAQLLTYLKLSKLRIGLILNFHCSVLRDGIRRRVL